MNTVQHPFSVIITVYDQARELEEQLPAFLKQEYEPGYEVIVVDESSTDETPDVLKLLKNEYKHLYSTFLPKPSAQTFRRKLALNIGIKASHHEYIIIAKANNAPAERMASRSPRLAWLRSICLANTSVDSQMGPTTS